MKINKNCFLLFSQTATRNTGIFQVVPTFSSSIFGLAGEWLSERSVNFCNVAESRELGV